MSGGLPCRVAAIEPANGNIDERTRLGAARAASTPSSDVSASVPRGAIAASAFASRDRIAKQATGNVRVAVVAAEREIDDGRFVAREQPGEAGAIDAKLREARSRAAAPAGGRSRCRSLPARRRRSTPSGAARTRS